MGLSLLSAVCSGPCATTQFPHSTTLRARANTPTPQHPDNLTPQHPNTARRHHRPPVRGQRARCGGVLPAGHGERGLHSVRGGQGRGRAATGIQVGSAAPALAGGGSAGGGLLMLSKRSCRRRETCASAPLFAHRRSGDEQAVRTAVSGCKTLKFLDNHVSWGVGGGGRQPASGSRCLPGHLQPCSASSRLPRRSNLAGAHQAASSRQAPHLLEPQGRCHSLAAQGLHPQPPPPYRWRAWVYASPLPTPLSQRWPARCRGLLWPQQGSWGLMECG